MVTSLTASTEQRTAPAATPVSRAGSSSGAVATPLCLRRRGLSRQLPSDDLRRLDHDAALLLGLLDRARLEATVGMRQEPLLRHVAQAPPDAFRRRRDRLGLVRVHVDDADGEFLREPIAVEQLQPPISVVRHREVELVDRELEDLRIDRGEVAVADVRDRLGGEVLRYDTHGLDRDLDLLRARVDRGLVDLDVTRAGGLEILRLLPHDLRERERRVAARSVRLVVRPVEQRVGAREHALHRAIGERLREAEPLDGHRLWTPDRRGDDRLVVIAVPVRAHEAADAEALETLREVGHHVAPVHLAVDEDVEVEALLASDPLLGRPPLELGELGLAQLPARVRVARLLQIIGLAERADRRREQHLIAHAFTPPAACAAVTSALSFCTATSCGRYSSPVVGASQRYSAGIRFSAASMKRTSSPSVSTRVLRASTIPRTTV